MKLENGRFLRITELYAFVSKDDKGHEGIIGMTLPNGVFMPFIGADVDRVEMLKPLADKICADQKMEYEIRYFSFNADKKQ